MSPYPQLEFISYRHIFLDANVLIDAFEHPEPFYDVFNFLKEEDKSNILFTINSVAVEFLRGSRSISEFEKKKAFILSITNSEIYTLTKAAEDAVLELTLLYRSTGGSISTTDFYLAAMLKQFSVGKALVMSKDHKAFPTSIFDRNAVLNIENVSDVQSFGFYSFNNNKYEQILERLV